MRLITAFFLTAMMLIVCGCITSSYDDTNRSNGTGQTNITNKTSSGIVIIENQNITIDSDTLQKNKSETIPQKPPVTPRETNASNTTTAAEHKGQNTTETPQNKTSVQQELCKGASKPDFFNRNTTEYNKTAYSDVCITISTVKDYYCSNGKLVSENYGCSPDYDCYDGRCQTPTMKCIDKDGGNITAVRGQIIVIRSLSTITDRWDECIDISTVKEWICDETNSAVSDEVKCVSGKKCLDGRCVPSACFDTDDGEDIYKVGAVTGEVAGAIETATDTCPSSESVREYYCHGDSLVSRIIRCPEKMSCQNGACKS